MEEAALRAHQSSFLRLKRKLFVLQPVCLLTKHGYLCFSLPPKIDIIVHMDVELNPGPASSSLRSKRKWPYRECRSGRTVKVRKATKVLIFNPPWHLVVTNLHFTQDGMTTILFVFRWYKIGHAEVHHEVSLFGMLAHWKPKYRCYVILCHLVVLTFYLWINCGLPRTIALPLPTSLIYLKITLFITCLDPPAEEVDLLLSHAKGFMFREIKAVVFYVRTFWFNHHLWWQGFSPCDSISTSTAQEKWLYSRKVFLRILCVLRGVDCYILSTPSLRWLQLSRRWQLKCKRPTILWLSFFCLSTITYTSSLGTHLGTGRRDVKKAFCVVKCALTLTATVLSH